MIFALPALCFYSLLAVLVRLCVKVGGRRFPWLRALPNRVFFLLGIVLYLVGVLLVRLLAGSVEPVYMDLPLIVASLLPWLVVFIPRRESVMVTRERTNRKAVVSS